MFVWHDVITCEVEKTCQEGLTCRDCTLAELRTATTAKRNDMTHKRKGRSKQIYLLCAGMTGKGTFPKVT